MVPFHAVEQLSGNCFERVATGALRDRKQVCDLEVLLLGVPSQGLDPEPLDRLADACTVNADQISRRGAGRQRGDVIPEFAW